MRTAGTIARLYLLAAAILFSISALWAGQASDDIANDNKPFIAPSSSVEPDTIIRPLLKDILKELHESAGIYFLYNDDDIGNTRVNKPDGWRSKPEQVLTEVLAGTGLTYRLVNSNTIVIIRRKGDEREPVVVGNNDPPRARGRVLNEDGQPLPGASVMIKGTHRGAMADQQGYFSIAALPGEILTISNIGYQSQEWPAGKTKEVRLLPQLASGEMQEVTITALGIWRDAKSLGYAATRVNGSALTKVRENNPGNILTGLIAGVNSSSPLTGPGGSSRVTIRGNSSLSFDNQPLYVVNGIPVNNDNLGNAGKFGGADFGDGICSINIDDIEELQVLKGGAAAALYGQRGRNGVILIHTRSAGNGDGINVSYNNNTQLDLIRDFTNFQQEYGQGLQGNKPADAAAAMHSGLYSWGAPLDGSSTAVFDGSLYPYSAVAGNNQQQFYQTGMRMQQTLALSGTSANMQWRTSLGDLRSRSVYPNSGYNRHSVTSDLRYSLSPKWSGHTYLQYSKEVGRNRPNINDAPGNGNFAIMFLPPNVDARWLSPGYDENGQEIVYNDNAFNTNPYFAASRFRNNTDRDRVWGMTKLRYQWKPWLYIQGRLAHDFFAFHANSITPAGTAYKPEGTINLERNFRYNETNADILLGIDKELGSQLHLNFAAGGNIMRMRSHVTDVSADGLAFPFIYSSSTASNSSISTLSPKKNVHSLYASLQLGWKERLFATFTDRQDWSSTLPSGKNSYNYPSVSVAYALHKHLRWHHLDELRIRAAYSRVGGDAPLFATRLYYNTNGNINGNPIGGMASQVPNSNLEPLQVRELETGFDAWFFNKRLHVDMAWYRKQTLNDIVAASVSITSGYESALMNVGRLENKGFEWLISGEPVRNQKFRWSAAFNFAHNTNKVIRLSEGQPGMQVLNGESRTERAFVQHITGLPFAQIMIFDVLRNQDGVPVLGNAGLQPSEQLTPAGTSIHPVTGGWLNQLSWGAFELEWLFDYKFGAVLYSGTYATAVQRGLDPSTLEGRKDGIHLQGVDANGNSTTQHVSAQQYYESLYRISSLHVFSADFVKLRSFSLTWNIPDGLLKKWKAHASVSVVGRNLFYVHRNTPHIDPEANYSNGNAQGLEYASLPATRSIGLNLQINFR